MLRILKGLEGYTVSATDGSIGTVADFYVDDERWTIRYLVAETGGFFSGRPVLVSPISFREADWATREFHVAMTKERVKDSPSVDVHKPVSRQFEREYLNYYGYPDYWGSTGLWGMGAHPGVLAAQNRGALAAEQASAAVDEHLRSTKEIRGYSVHGSDVVVGHIDDFIVDDETWQVRYLVIATNTQWFGKRILIAPQWTVHISWMDRMIHVNIPREGIQACPEWDPSAPINREFETRLYDYYGRPVAGPATQPVSPVPAPPVGHRPG